MQRIDFGKAAFWAALRRLTPRMVQYLMLATIVAFVGYELSWGAEEIAQASPADVAAGSALSEYKLRKLAEVSPYIESRRWETYVAVSDVFDRLWRQPASRTTVASGNFNRFKAFPRLILEDRDNDKKAEFFSYRPSSGSQDTQEFGAYFDLNGHGRPDWIVYYGGLMLTKDQNIFWWHQQLIDRNGDGRFDVRIYSAIDMDGDGMPEKGATAWVYDDDFDGRVDRAEYIVDGKVTPIVPEKNGNLPLHSVMRNQARVGGPIDTSLFDAIVKDIVSLKAR